MITISYLKYFRFEKSQEVKNWPEIGGFLLKTIPVNLHYNQGIKFSTVLLLSALLLIAVIVLGELNII